MEGVMSDSEYDMDEHIDHLNILIDEANENIKALEESVRMYQLGAASKELDVVRLREQMQHFAEARRSPDWPDFNAEGFMEWVKSRCNHILSTPPSTEALDEYVAGRVKEALKGKS